ncbi:type VII secretion-associated serine protease mycosin [Micromonospora purpureochromogenes]|uniref:type VII secretion-associated serine protease mycosin n=1 Tax=Micromonospora purpureochromogenes TaxID=47872 RepID=UPI003F4D2A0C
MGSLARTLLTIFALSSTLLTAAPLHAKEPQGADRVRGDQWHLRYLRVPKVQRISQGEGVVVAVPDTGVAPHADLIGNVLPGTDILSDGDGRQDQDSHGTGMAGLIAAHGNGDRGALGIAPKAKILPVRVKRINEQGNSDDLAAGIEYSVAQGAEVISISSVSGPDLRLQQAIETALRANIIVVAGAGNRPREREVGFPAAYPSVIAVGGTDRNGNQATVSVAGPEIDVVAPAVDIYSTSIDGKYRKGTGTSDATAIVAGAAALIRSKYPHLPAQEVAHRLTATAVDKGPPGRDDEYGYGVINLVAALTADVPPLGFESTVPSATSGSSPTTAAASPSSDSGDGATARGLATLGAIVAASGSYLLWRRRRRADDPPPKISR